MTVPEQIISNIIDSANTELSTNYYLIVGSVDLMNLELKNRAMQKDSDNYNTMPLVWLPDDYTQRTAERDLPYQYEVDNLRLFFIFKGDGDRTYEQRQTNNIQPNIETFVSEFINQAAYNGQLYRYNTDDNLESEKEYHANFAQKLYQKSAIPDYSDAIELKLNRFHINYTNC